MAVTELVLCIHIDQMEPILCGVEFDSQSPVVASHGRQVISDQDWSGSPVSSIVEIAVESAVCCQKRHHVEHSIFERSGIESVSSLDG
jgi:hypothetical protein